MAPKTVFLLGAGYIGQNVLDQLRATGYEVTTLVRRPEQASVFEKSGIKTVAGTLSDLDLLTTQAAQHEITINTASCDDLPSVEAILSGVRSRVHAGLPTIYLHTSGTGILMDGAMGMSQNNKIYRDDVPEDIDAIPITSMHRHVDIPIIQAAHEFGDKAKIVILYPPLIYGLDPVHNRHSFALVKLVNFALKHGFSGYVGEGRNLWSVVHVKDLARANSVVLTYLENSAPAAILENPYFFAENGSEISMGEGAEHLGQILHEMGKIQSPNVKAFVDSDYEDVMGPMTPVGLGCNSRSRAIRLRELGWKPKETDIWTSWAKDEIPSIVAAAESPTA